MGTAPTRPTTEPPTLGCRGGRDTIPAGRHISLVVSTRITSSDMRDLVPGGFVFTHAVFWSVVAMVAVGTNAVAIILMIGLGAGTITEWLHALPDQLAQAVGVEAS